MAEAQAVAVAEVVVEAAEVGEAGVEEAVAVEVEAVEEVEAAGVEEEVEEVASSVVRSGRLHRRRSPRAHAPQSRLPAPKRFHRPGSAHC